MMKDPDIIVVIHLSATSVQTVIGQIYHAQDIRIIGLSSVPTYGFFQGQIRHYERLKSAIKQSVQEAEDMANCRINSVWLSFSTPELISQNSVGEVYIDGNLIQAKDIVAALENAKSKSIKDNLYLMHYYQQGIVLDNAQQMIDDAIGMTAKHLTVMYHLMMMPVKSRQNLQLLLQECDISVDHMLFDAVSSGEYGLLTDEKQQGVCLIDIGYGSTSICVYHGNRLLYTHCLDEGGHNVTLDIAMEMDFAINDAEILKKNYTNVDRKSINPSDFFSYRCHGQSQERNVSVQELLEVAEARYISILFKIKQILQQTEFIEYLHQGYVLTGGGAEIRGLLPLAKQILGNSKIHKVNQHSAITAHTPFGDDDEKLRNMAKKVASRQYQTAFGVLLYSQSDAFKYSEKSSMESLKEVVRQQKIRKLSDWLRKIF